MSSTLTVAVVMVVLYWVATAAAQQADNVPFPRAEMDEREPQADDAAQSPTYNNGLYTPFTATSAQAKATPSPKPSPSPSPTSATVKASSAAPSPVSSPASSTSTAVSSPASTPASSSVSSSASTASPSASASASPSSPPAGATTTDDSGVWRWDLTLSPYTPATIFPDTVPTAASSASSSGSATTGLAAFKPVYLIPGIVLLLSVVGYFLGRYIYRRRRGKRGVGSLYTAEADLGWEDDKYREGDGYDRDYKGAYDEKRDSATERLVKGWGEHMLSYSSTDIFGEEPAPAALAPAPVPAYTPASAPAYSQGYGYAPVSDPPSKPRGNSLYRRASRLLPRSLSRGASWFRRPEPAPQGGGKLYGPRSAPPHRMHQPAALPQQTYNAHAPAYGELEEKREERVKSLLIARRVPMLALPEEVYSQTPAQEYSDQRQGIQLREQYSTEQPDFQQNPTQEYHPYSQEYPPTPMTTSSASVYSLASPPPAPVRTLGGLGRQQTVRAQRGMEGIGEGEEWDVPQGGLSSYRVG